MGLDAEAQRSVAAVFFVEAPDVGQRDVPLDPLFRAEVCPDVHIDAVRVGNAKQPLRVAHDRADALFHRVGQLDSWHAARVGSRQRTDARIVLGIAQPLLEPAIG